MGELLNEKPKTKKYVDIAKTKQKSFTKYILLTSKVRGKLMDPKQKKILFRLSLL